MKRTLMTLLALSLAACGVGVEDEPQLAQAQQEIVAPKDSNTGLSIGRRTWDLTPAANAR